MVARLANFGPEGTPVAGREFAAQDAACDCSVVFPRFWLSSRTRPVKNFGIFNYF